MSQRTFRKKYLVIDDANALDVNNLQRKVNQASKHPEPVLRADAPWNLEDKHRMTKRENSVRAAIAL